MRKIKEFYRYVIGKYNGMPVFAILALIVLMIINNGISKKGSDKNNENIAVNDHEIQEGISDFTNEEDDTLSIYGIKEIKIKGGCTEAELYYVNPEQNADKYYISVSITLKVSGETIYKSELIPPGMGITKIEINKELPKGNYPAVFHIQGYKMNDLSSAKGADLDIEIIVE